MDQSRADIQRGFRQFRAKQRNEDILLRHDNSTIDSLVIYYYFIIISWSICNNFLSIFDPIIIKCEIYLFVCIIFSMLISIIDYIMLTIKRDHDSFRPSDSKYKNLFLGIYRRWSTSRVSKSGTEEEVFLEIICLCFIFSLRCLSLGISWILYKENWYFSLPSYKWKWDDLLIMILFTILNIWKVYVRYISRHQYKPEHFNVVKKTNSTLDDLTRAYYFYILIPLSILISLRNTDQTVVSLEIHFFSVIAITILILLFDLFMILINRDETYNFRNIFSKIHERWLNSNVSLFANSKDIFIEISILLFILLFRCFTWKENWYYSSNSFHFGHEFLLMLFRIFNIHKIYVRYFKKYQDNRHFKFILAQYYCLCGDTDECEFCKYFKFCKERKEFVFIERSKCVCDCSNDDEEKDKDIDAILVKVFK